MNRLLNWMDHHKEITTAIGVAFFVLGFFGLVAAAAYDEHDEIDYMDGVVAVYTGERLVGSGFVVGDGKVITNWHVSQAIADGEAYIEWENGDRVHATKTWHMNNNADAALLSFDSSEVGELQVLDLACDYEPVRGDEVNIYGSPLAVMYTETQGHVASNIIHEVLGMNRTELRLIAMDASVGPGNSGGPVMHDGEVIGITTAMKVSRVGSIGVSLALPISVVCSGIMD